MEYARVGRPSRWVPEMRGNVDPATVPVTFITDTQEAVDLIHTLGPGVVAMDTETVYIEGKVDPFTAKLRVISLATTAEDGSDVAYVLDVKDMDRMAIGQAFRDRAKELGARRLEVLGFNANFDDPVTTYNLTDAEPGSPGMVPLVQWVDLMFGVTIRRLGAPGNRWRSLAWAAKRYLGVDMSGKGGVQLSYDESTPLTEEQVDYAAQDAVVTLWLGDALVDPLQKESLLEAFTLETRARPFLQAMTVNGLAFKETEWMQHVAEGDARAQEILAEMAEMTGGQPTLFGSATPNFNPDSPDGVRKALNTYCSDLVEFYLTTTSRYRRPTTLQPYDSVDKTMLGLLKAHAKANDMDHHLIDLLLEYSSLSKVRSTYGESMMAMLDETGRFHSEYTQCLIATGRTSSSKPNAQNFSPQMKPFFVPAPRVDDKGCSHERVLLQGDYSQAELRVSAQFTGEPTRREAFSNSVDQHAAVAAQMFNVNMLEMAEGDPEAKARYAKFRSQAKTINFGLGYGMKAALLSDTLTLQGIMTDRAQAGKLIDDFFTALPKEAAWLRKRDDYVFNLGNRVIWAAEVGSKIDFDVTFRLYDTLALISATRTSLRKRGRSYDIEDIIDTIHGEGSLLGSVGTDGLTRDQVADLVNWAREYDTAVVLTESGAPWEFFSKTASGRRRVFQVTTDSWMDALVKLLARPDNPSFQLDVDRWALSNHLQLATNPHHIDEDTGAATPNPKRKPLGFGQLRKVFENKRPLRDNFVRSMLDLAKGKVAKMPNGAATMDLPQRLMRLAMSSCIERLANAYRNAPIQGTVADAVLYAFWKLYERLDEYHHVFPVLSVHDSIVVEVDLEDAYEVSTMMKAVMEECLRYYVPDVTVRADLDVLYSLDAKQHTVPEDRYVPAPPLAA